MGEVRLVVQGDDFGMCHAVNEGIVTAFTDGILTESTLMAPCPWFWEASSLAVAHRIPCGVHATLTAEWDHLRWAPITSGASLAAEDGTFPRSIDDAKARMAAGEIVAELAAQVERVQAAGIEPIHCDCHMGFVGTEAYETVCERYGVRLLYPVVERSFSFESISFLSDHGDHAEKLSWLTDRLEGLEAGTHLLITHPAVVSAELGALTAGDVPIADRLRVSDLSVLTSPEIRELVPRLGIELVNCADL